jgi:sugar lactone lactonase YvrE
MFDMRRLHRQHAPIVAFFAAMMLLGLTGASAAAVSPTELTGTILTVAGNGSSAYGGDGGAALSAGLLPDGLATDGAGDLYIADAFNHRVRKVTPDGRIRTVAGTGVSGSSGDGGLATAARLAGPRGLAVDPSGNLYIVDLEANRVRRVAANGVITTVAGNGARDSTGDGGSATAAALAAPMDVAVDSAGTLFIATATSIRKVTAGGTISTFAQFSGTNGSSTCTGSGAWGVALDAARNLYAADPNCGGLNRVSPLGIVTHLRSGIFSDVAVDAIGNVYVGDLENYTVGKLAPSGQFTSVAGGGIAGYSGDGGPATAALLGAPLALAADSDVLYISDSGNRRVRMIAPNRKAGTIAGSGVPGPAGDGGAAAAAQLNFPSGVAVDRAGNVYVADSANNRIRVIGAAGSVTTFAGTGVAGFSGDGGVATGAEISSPTAVAFDPAGALLIADTGNNRVRKVSTTGVITTIAGSGSAGFAGDGGRPGAALLDRPSGVAADGTGSVYIADTLNHRVRKIVGGRIITFAGSGAAGLGQGAYGGDGGKATAARLNLPEGIALDPQGGVYVSDTGNNRVRRVDKAGTITTLAGTGARRFSGDGGQAGSAELAAPSGLSVDGAGNLYIADSLNNRVRIVTPAGLISTLIGIGTPGFSGDGGPGTLAHLARPKGLAVDATGRVLVADYSNQRVRVLDNAPPTAAFALQRPSSGRRWPVLVRLDAWPASSDRDGRIVAYSWRFSDSGIADVRLADGPSVTHSFSIPGKQTATLTVRDSAGVARSTSQSVTVPCTLSGTDGSDVISATAAADAICARGGSDAVDALGGDDAVLGGTGDDTIAGGAGNDYLAGGPGDDRLIGGPGADVLVGGPGGDEFDARDGVRDIIYAGTQDKDKLVIDVGLDIVRYGPAPGS